MSYNGVKMTNPRLDANTIINYVCANSSLTREQVRECFHVYSEMLTDLTASNYFNNELTIVLPSMGQFYFGKQAGRKKGSTYCALRGLDRQMVVQEEDKPDYYMLKFKPFNRIKQAIRENTEFIKNE